MLTLRLCWVCTGFDRQWLTGQPRPGLGNGDKGARMTHGTRVAAYQQEKLQTPILQLLRVICVSLDLDKSRSVCPSATRSRRPQ